MALGQQAFWDLERWLSSGSSQRLGLLGVERETECRGQELLRLLLQEHIDRRGTGDVGASLQVTTPDGAALLYTHKRLYTRRLITLFGAKRVWASLLAEKAELFFDQAPEFEPEDGEPVPDFQFDQSLPESWDA